MCEAIAIAVAVAITFSTGLIGEAWVRVAKIRQEQGGASLED